MPFIVIPATALSERTTIQGERMMTEEQHHEEDAEDVKAREAYLGSLVADCPAFPPDPRQAHFYEHLDQWRKDPEMKDQKFIGMAGFPASTVDLGWLKD